MLRRKMLVSSLMLSLAVGY